MPGIPPQPGTAGARHCGHLLYPQDIAARKLCPSVRTLVIHSLWPLSSSRRKHTCSYLSSALFSFSSSYGRASMGRREIQQREPKLNVLEMSTRCWWSHSMVTSQLGSPGGQAAAFSSSRQCSLSPTSDPRCMEQSSVPADALPQGCCCMAMVPSPTSTLPHPGPAVPPTSGCPPGPCRASPEATSPGKQVVTRCCAQRGAISLAPHGSSSPVLMSP